jgi:hypothetical protein
VVRKSLYQFLRSGIPFFYFVLLLAGYSYVPANVEKSPVPIASTIAASSNGRSTSRPGPVAARSACTGRHRLDQRRLQVQR